MGAEGRARDFRGYPAGPFVAKAPAGVDNKAGSKIGGGIGSPPTRERLLSQPPERRPRFGQEKRHGRREPPRCCTTERSVSADALQGGRETGHSLAC